MMEDRSEIREIHGIANARKLSASAVENSNLQPITVTDGLGEVEIRVWGYSYPCAMTPEQAESFARQISASAIRVKLRRDGEKS